MGAEIYMVSIPGQANQEFVDGFKKAKGFYPTWLRGKAYAATMFWARAVKKAGNGQRGRRHQGLGRADLRWSGRQVDHARLRPPDRAAGMGRPDRGQNPYFSHAFVGPAKAVASEKITTPCEQTGCKDSRSSLAPVNTPCRPWGRQGR